jgi:hypothetical protein
MSARADSPSRFPISISPKGPNFIFLWVILASQDGPERKTKT